MQWCYQKVFWCPRAITHDANCASMSKTGFYPRAETYEASFRLKTGGCPRAETYEAICAFMLKTGCTLVASTYKIYKNYQKKWQHSLENLNNEDFIVIFLTRALIRGGLKYFALTKYAKLILLTQIHWQEQMYIMPHSSNM